MTQAFFMCTVKTQVRLGGYPGWPESSQVAHALLLVLLCTGSKRSSHLSNEYPQHVSHNIWKHTLYPTKTKISLYICTIWSAFSFFPWRDSACLASQNVPSEDSYLTVWMCRLIWIFAGYTSDGTFYDIVDNIFLWWSKNKKSVESDVAPVGIKSYKFLFVLKKIYFSVFKKLMG